MLLSNLSVLLLKATVIICNGHRLRHDRIIGVGEIWRLSLNENENIWTIQGSVTGGRDGGECSWSVQHFVEVKVGYYPLYCFQVLMVGS
jgi:hypothetical protein